MSVSLSLDIIQLHMDLNECQFLCFLTSSFLMVWVLGFRLAPEVSGAGSRAEAGAGCRFTQARPLCLHPGYMIVRAALLESAGFLPILVFTIVDANCFHRPASTTRTLFCQPSATSPRYSSRWSPSLSLAAAAAATRTNTWHNVKLQLRFIITKCVDWRLGETAAGNKNYSNSCK